MEQKYWVVVTNLENFKATKKECFIVDGFKERYIKLVEEIQCGDKFVHYIIGKGLFGAIAEAASGYYPNYESNIFPDENEIYPLRCQTQPLLVLDEDKMPEVKRLVKALDFITPQQKNSSWGLAIRGKGLIKISKKDFDFIESEMRKGNA